MYTYADGKFELHTSIPTGHTKTVRGLAWSPSGTSLATASFDSNIGIWQQEEADEEGGGAGEWECIAMLEGHETECKSVAWSAEGNLLASCSRDKTVWVWEGTSLISYAYPPTSDILLVQLFPMPILSAWECSWSIPKT